MKKLFLFLFVIFVLFSRSQVAYTWNGSTSTAWNVSTNWTPNGIPGTVDNVTIVSGPNACLLNANTTINNLTLTSGTLTLGGFTLNPAGTGACNGGTATAGTLNYTGASLTFAGTLFNATVTANVTDVYFNGSTFNAPLTVVRTNTSNIQSAGNNVYNGPTSITNSGTGYLLLTNNSAKTEVVNSPLTLNATSSGNLYFASNGSATLAANVVVNNTGSASIFCGQNGTVTLNAGVTITTGTFAGGALNLYKFNQPGATPQNFAPGANGSVAIYNSTFPSSVTVTAGNISSSGSTYLSPVIFNKNGGTSLGWPGGNTFQSTLTMNHTGSGYWCTGNGTADIFNGTLYLNNTSSAERIIIGQYSSNNQVNGDVYVTQGGAAQGISIGWNGPASPYCTFATNKTVYIGPAGFTTGYLQLSKTTQANAMPLTLTVTGTADVILNNNVFTGSVNINSPDIQPYGGTYNAPVVLTKTGGGGSNHNNGNLNIFNSTLSLENQSNTGYLLLGFNSADQFNDNVTLTCSGSGGISLGWSGGTGTPSLAAGKTLLVGPGGFSAGFLQLGSFTQLGSSPITLTLTGTANFQVLGNSQPSLFGGALDVTAPDIYIRGGIFNGSTAFTKTGGGSDHNNGVQNIFNSTCTINQQSNSGYFMLGYNSADQFNDNILVSSTGSGGIYLGWTSGTGTPSLAAGKTILVGSGGFSTGFLQLNTFTQLGSAPINLNFTGPTAYLSFARNTVIGGNLNTTTPSIYFNGATFNGAVNALKTGTNGDQGTGGNTFQGVASFTNASTNYLVLGNPNPDTWNNDVYFVNTSTERLLPCWNSAGNLFNGNISVSSTGSAQGIQFGSNASCSSTLAAGKTIQIGAGGYTSGFLILPQFTQLGSAPVTLSLSTGSNYFSIGPNSLIGGVFNLTAPIISSVNQSVFNSTVNITKTGTSNDQWPGGNTYNAIANFTNAGTGYMGMGWSLPDTWNGDAVFTSSGTERVLPGWVATGNTFKGNVIANSTGSAVGVAFCGGGGNATVSSGKSILVGSAGFTSGYLILKNITQLGSAAVNLTLSSTANYIQYGPGSSFGGNVSSLSPGLFFNGSTFAGSVTCVKTGSTSDAAIGNNVFNGSAIMTNSGSGYLMFGNGNNDQFNAASVFNNTGSSHIYLANNSTGNVFSGPLTLNNSPTSAGSWIYVASNATNNSVFNGNITVTCNNGAGVYFGSGGGTSTLSAGKTISVGGSGFNAGGLIFKNFTQAGSTAQSFTTTGASYIQYGPGAAFGGNVASLSPGLLFNGSTFSGSVACIKNGSTNDAAIGNNVFNGTAVMTNTGSGYLMFGNGNADQFNAASVFNNAGSANIYLAYNSTGNVFNAPVTLNNAPTLSTALIYVASYQANNSQFNDVINVSSVNSGGIVFGNSGGTSTLSAGKTITIAGGFNAGALALRQFTQLGTTSQSLTTTGTSNIQFGPTSSFGGNVTTLSPSLFFNTTTFNGTVSCTKNGSSNDASNGGNVFNSPLSLTTNSTGNLVMANSASDAYNSDVTFVQGSTGGMYPNYNSNCTYAGNITVTSPSGSAISFGGNTLGMATFSGAANQTISKTGTTPNPIFTRLIMSKASGSLSLNTTIAISSSLTLTSGIITTSSTTILNMNNSSSVSIGNASSYINGPMNYDMAFSGSRVLSFPLGKGADWRPAILNITHGNGTSYTYNSEVFNTSAATLSWTLPPTVNRVSYVHYWDLNRVLTSSGVSTPTAGLSGNQTVTLFYDNNDGVNDPSFLTVCKNTYTSATTWKDIGGTGATATTGSVSSTSSPSAFNSFSRFTLGNLTLGINPLPIQLVSFAAALVNKQTDISWTTATEHNNDHFEVERSKDAVHFELLTTVPAYGTGNYTGVQHYSCEDLSPYAGLSYYRLKQVDKDQSFTYSDIVYVSFSSTELVVYPNPVSNRLFLKGCENYKNAQITITNELGVEVLLGDIMHTGIDVSGLTSGIYFVSVNNGISSARTKITVLNN